MRKEKRLIIALDMMEATQAVETAKATAAYVDAFKVNYPLVLSVGLGIVDTLGRFGDVLCDFKVADIPATNRLIVEQAFDHGASGVIAHGFPGRDSLEACLEAAQGDVFVVTAMSHPGAERFLLPQAKKLAQLAVDVGAAGIIAGATRPEVIRELRELVGPLLILSPGVGVQGGSPGEALREGADYLIVGRSITQSEDAAKAADDLLGRIQRAGAM
ncbi:MAG: orotidine-5'-phosphate decarboxylase, partial [Thermoplasmata archaeon]